jgi:hypothetical protein
MSYSTIRALIMSLVVGIAIGFVIYPEVIHPAPIPREQAADAYLCGIISDEARVQREILHDGDAVRSQECDTSKQRTKAYLCGEIANEERVQREIFNDESAIPLPECDPLQLRAEAQAGETVDTTASAVERLLAWFSGKSKVASSDQPKSLASTPW